VEFRRLEERSPELNTVSAVVDPGAARLDELAGRDHRGMAKDGDQVALAARLDPQHAEPVLLVVERDALYQASQDLGRCPCAGWLPHRGRFEPQRHMPRMRAPTSIRTPWPGPLGVNSGAMLGQATLSKRSSNSSGTKRLREA